MIRNCLFLLFLLFTQNSHCQFIQTGKYISLNPQGGLQSYEEVFHKILTIEPDNTFMFSFSYMGGWGKSHGFFYTGRWKQDKDTLLLQFYFTSLQKMLTVKYRVKDDRLIVMNDASLPQLKITNDFKLEQAGKWRRIISNIPGCFSIGLDTGCNLDRLVKKFYVKTIKSYHF